MCSGSSRVKNLSNTRLSVVSQRGQGERNPQVLHHFGEEEAFSVIHTVVGGDGCIVYVKDSAYAAFAAWNFKEFEVALNCTLSARNVLWITGDTPRIEIGLEHLGTQDIVAPSVEDVEAMLIVKFDVSRGDGVSCKGPVVCSVRRLTINFADEAEYFGANLCSWDIFVRTQYAADEETYAVLA